MDNSLTRWKRPNFKIPFSRISNSSVWKPNFSPRQAKPKILFALHCHYTGDTQYRVWFDLDNSLTRWKRTIFKIRENSQYAKFAKFRMKTHFFLGKQYQQLFALHCHYTGDTPYWVWFDLDNSLTDENELFLKFAKICTSRNSQNSVWKPILFLRQAIPKKTFCCTLIALVIHNTEFGLIGKTHWPDEKELFLKFSKIRNSRISQKPVWKPKVFPRQAIPKVLFSLHSHYTGDTPYRVWFDLDISLTR